MKDSTKKKEAMKAVLVDIDGTLVTVTDFDYDIFNKDDKSQIDEYLKYWNAETMNASALVGGIEMLKKFKEEGYALVFLTSRGQGCRVYTKKKLKEIGKLFKNNYFVFFFTVWI